MDINKTDERIYKLYQKGISIEKIAKCIGRPGDIERVKAGLIRKKIIIEE